MTQRQEHGDEEYETEPVPRLGTGTLEDTTEHGLDGEASEYATDDGAGGVPPVAGAEPAAPKPPPASWGSWNDGPGSPAGSVRPPDTTATADASADTSYRGRPGTFAILVAALVGAVLGTAMTLALSRTVTDVAAPDVRAPVLEPANGEGVSIAAVAEAVTPSVVRIDRFGTGESGTTGTGLGSGVIYRSDGYILTNNHVVEGADELQVLFADGERLEATIVGTDPLTDLAVLKVDREGLPAINIREGPINVGETAIAIGAPFGLNASVTAGIVSGVDRHLEVPIDDGFISIPNIIQTDAAINPGNSGGALVDGNGRLIGINTAILASIRAGEMPGFQGVGFAISVHDATGIADELIEHGVVRHARLGISGGSVTRQVAEQLDLDVTGGVYVDQVLPGGPADEAGLQSGDIVVGAAGREVGRMDELVAIIREHEPGDTMTVTVRRGGEQIEIDVVLGAWE